MQFLLIFFIGTFCFGFAFWTLSNNNIATEENFINSFQDAITYSYLLSLGSFQI